MKREIFDYIDQDSMIETVFNKLIPLKQLSIYRHPGEWKCMDTYKEVEEMNVLWQNNPFWKIWK